MVMSKRIFFVVVIFCIGINLLAQPIKSYGPTPTRQQLVWHDMEFYLFIHFGPNTFSDLEWGHGTEDPNSFNPTALDCKQWANIAKQSGAKGIIITAKHHDGFCLWPSNFSKHTVRESKWRDGKGDVVRELSNACKAYGLKFGIYVSPWDRNHPKYGTPEYNAVYIETMKELIGKYGPIFELWWDGANGEGPNGKKQVYDFALFEKTARRIAPNTVVFSDIGPDIRWVGNENGIAATTNWNLLDTAGFKRGNGAPPQDTLNRGNVNGKNWIPAECDVSIRPGWFYHSKEDDKVKTAQQLMKLYLQSVGRGASFLLNVPPDRRGLFHQNDSAALVEFKKLKDEFYKENLALKASVNATSTRTGYPVSNLTDGNARTHWAAPDENKSATIEIILKGSRTFNTIVLQESIEFGQRIISFTVEAWDGAKYNEVAKGTTVGHKRIIQFRPQQASKLRVTIKESKAAPVLNSIELYNAPDYGAN